MAMGPATTWARPRARTLKRSASIAREITNPAEAFAGADRRTLHRPSLGLCPQFRRNMGLQCLCIASPVLRFRKRHWVSEQYSSRNVNMSIYFTRFVSDRAMEMTESWTGDNQARRRCHLHNLKLEGSMKVGEEMYRGLSRRSRPSSCYTYFLQVYFTYKPSVFSQPVIRPVSTVCASM